MDRSSHRHEHESSASHRPLWALVPLTLLPAASLLAGVYGLFPLCCVPLLMLGTALLFRDHSEPAEPGDADADGPGGEGGSPMRGGPPCLPGGGLLLPDAIPAARRYRGEPASPLIPSRTRRPAHPPERRPVPARH